MSQPTQPDLLRRIGQLFIVGFPGPEIDSELRSLLAEGLVGGVILFPRNFRSKEQIRELVSEMQEVASGRLIISVDQEGGRVQRLGPALGFTPWPPAETVADRCREATNLEPAREMGLGIGTELREMGIHLDWAPVVDLRTNPDNQVIADRAWGSDPESVVQRAGAFLDGLEASGVGGCLKHFPGHGDTWADSHLELPRLDSTLEGLEEREIQPFVRMMERVGLIMTGHLLIPNIDPVFPVTLSEKWVNQYLKHKLNFSGAVVSDALEMKAIRDRYSLTVASILAFKAGCDFLMQAEGLEGVGEAVSGLAEAVGKEISYERLEDAVGRAENYKRRLRF